MANTLTCPSCGNTEQGAIVAYEEPAIYDGVLIWQCGECMHAWPRFSPDSVGRRRLHDRATQIIAYWDGGPAMRRR